MECKSCIELLTQLKTELTSFFDELIDLLPQEPDLVIVRLFINTKIPTSDIMEYICKEIVPLKNLVKTRDEKFFIENNILFSKLDATKVNHFKNLWESNSLCSEDKDTIWRWFQSFIYLAEKYLSLKSQ